MRRFAAFLFVPLALFADESISGYRGSADPEIQKFWDVQQSVAKITVPIGVATAWVVGSKYMLTNQHVIRNASDAENATVSFLDDTTGGPGDGYSDLKLVKLGGGDWALFEINDGDWDAVAHPPLEMDLEPQPHQLLYVIGHPDRRISRYSDDDRDNFAAINPGLPPGTEGLGHTWADSAGNLAGSSYGMPTAAGYSGSPVMTIVSGEHRAVALHRGPSNGIWLFHIEPSIFRWLPPRAKGAVGFDLLEGRIQDDGDVEVVLLDRDLAGNGSHVLTVTTDSGDSESLTLMEQNEPGTFSGTLLLTDLTDGVTSNNGTLEVASMDRVMTTYLDADDGSGSPATVFLAEPVDRRAPNGWMLNPRADSMTNARIDFHPDSAHLNRYTAEIQALSSLLPHTTPTVHTNVGDAQSVPVNLSTPLRLYGMPVNSIEIRPDGKVVVGGVPAYELHVFGFSQFGQSCTVKVEETASGLLVTWEDVSVSVGSDNVAYIGASTSFQLFWSLSGQISFLYSDAAPSSSQASIGLVDGPETDDFVATDFLALPRGDTPVTGPLIVFQPLDQRPPFYYPVQFQVSAVGQGTLHYKWFENGVEVPGQTSNFFSSFTPPAGGSADYYVEVTDDNGTVTSRVARYTMMPEVSVQLTDTNVREGEAATTLRLERQGVTTNALTVHFSVSGTASPGEDYWVSPQGGLDGAVTFPAGQSMVDLSVTARDDLLDEGTETLEIQLLPSNTYALSFQMQETLEITDDDQDPNFRTYLLNFGETAYTGPVGQTWQTFDLTSGNNPQHVNNQMLTDRNGNNSGGIMFGTSGGSPSYNSYPLHTALGESDLGAEPFGWFDASSSQQRETFAVRNGSSGWSFTFSGFSPQDVVDLEMVFARKGSSGDRQMTVTYESIGDVMRDQNVHVDNGGRYPVLRRLSGRSSYTLTIAPTGPGWGCLPNAIAVHVRHAFAEAPGEFTAFAESPQTVRLAWTDNSPSETGFRIERASSPSGPWTVRHIAPAGSEQYEDTLGTAGSYIYRVVVEGGASDGVISNLDASSGLDSDGDGALDDHEDEAGTNRTDPGSVLELTPVQAAGGIRLQGPTVAGRRYRLSWRESLITGDWTEESQWTSDGSDLDLPLTQSGFYRVDVWRP